MTDEKKLSPEEEKLIADISGAKDILDSAEVPQEGRMVADEDGIHRLDSVAQKEGMKAAIIDKASEAEDFTIDNTSETLGKTEDQLGADMVRLNGIDTEKQQQIKLLEGFDVQFEHFLRESKQWALKEKAEKLKDDLTKEYNLLGGDLRKRALANYKKNGEKKPALGLEIKMYKNREFSVDVNEAVQWCIEKDLKVFLDVDRTKYAEQLALGTFPDMPGDVDDSKIPKATISLKPYQEKSE